MDHKVFKMTEDEFQEGIDNYSGICLNCGDIVEDGIDPDATDYHCDACEEDMVMGFEQALTEDHIEIEV